MHNIYKVWIRTLNTTKKTNEFSMFTGEEWCPNIAIWSYIIECKTDNDCPISQLKIYAWKCVKNGCHLFDVIPMMYE
ncbi:hypothetical protein MTR_5g063560 [Medicago truncatula]|uniref:Nodule Cysteine-Rich (NCR) secreted peptide n=1 Tax=Medicago truncatula TaxID=3880 RepID=G7KAE5_MEDTR|nr:hypothetical protein MTR_5g063560 [Medicago truncatula]